MPNLKQEAANFSHELTLVFLLQSVAALTSDPKQFLSRGSGALIENLPNLIAIKTAPSPEVKKLVAERLETMFSSAALFYEDLKNPD